MAQQPSNPPVPRVSLLLAALLLVPGAPTWAETPPEERSIEAPPGPPSSEPVRLSQDALDFRGRSGIVTGSGARALGMGGAFLARADDATAASWNPAGLSYLRQPEMSFAGGGRTGDVTERRPEGTTVETSSGGSPDFASGAFPVELHGLSGSVQLSYQRAIGFDGTRNSVTPAYGSNPEVTKMFEGSGGFDVIALGAGFRVSRQWRAGLTVNRWFNGFEQSLVRTGGRGSVQRNEWGLAGWNVNAGVLWSPVEQVNLGAVVKTPFTADVTLFRTRTDASLVSTTPTTNTYSSNDVRIDFPRAFGVGISWRPRGTLQLALDYTRTQWSQGKIHNFFTLPPTPPGDDPPVPEPPDNVFPVLPYPTLDSTQTDDEQIRMGVEWVLLTRHFKLPLRIGYYNEGQNFRSATINVPRFDGFTVGAGVIVGPVLLDAAYIRLSGLYRDNSAFPITVLSHRWLVSAIYRHGSR